MKRNRNIKDISIVTAIAFFLSTMLPFLAVYDLSQVQAEEFSQSTSTSSLMGTKILICTPEGFKWVEVEDLQKHKEQQDPHSEMKCALCYLSIKGIKFTAPDTAIAAVYIPSFKYVTRYAPEVPLGGELFMRAFQTRAPPAVA